MRTREDHVEWCKENARKYLERNDIKNAVTSMMSDMSKHPETREIGKALEMLGLSAILHNDREGARRFIEGFN